MGRSRTRKIKSTSTHQEGRGTQDVFYVSLEEAKRAISDKYEFLAERYEQHFPKHKGLS
jgi:hypothetical protein